MFSGRGSLDPSPARISVSGHLVSSAVRSLGVTVGGVMLAAQWGIPSLFQASAVPQLCSALVILGLAFLSIRRGGAPGGETQHEALSVPEHA